ncbi:MAG: hypothetical protein WBB24_08235 [Maribacter sp.]
MNKQDLIGKELSNLYAIAKQVNDYFNGSDISFLNERRKGIVADYLQFSCKNEEDIAEMLRNINVNPGNTKDSIIEEITENLHHIALQKDTTNKLKSLGYMMSLNRLISYHIANIDNIRFVINDIEF